MLKTKHPHVMYRPISETRNIGRMAVKYKLLLSGIGGAALLALAGYPLVLVRECWRTAQATVESCGVHKHPCHPQHKTGKLKREVFLQPTNGFVTDGAKLLVTNDGAQTWKSIQTNVPMKNMNQLISFLKMTVGHSRHQVLGITQSMVDTFGRKPINRCEIFHCQWGHKTGRRAQ